MKNLMYYLKALAYYFEKILNTIKTNGVYIFLSVFFVFLLFFISDVTNDFVYALNEKGNFPNVFFISLSFFLMALALWVIPAFFIKLYLGSNADKDDILLYYGNFEEIYNGKKNEKKNQIPVKYLAIAPWIVFTITLSACLLKSLKIVESTWFIFVISLFVSFFILNFLSRKFKYIYEFFTKNKQRKNLFKIPFFVAILVLVFPLIISIVMPFTNIYSEIDFKSPEEVDRIYNTFLFFLILYNVLCIIFTFMFLVYKENEPVDVENKYNFSRKLHLLTIVLSISLLIIFCILSLNFKLIWISPVVILVILSTFFILLFELLYTTPRIIIIIDRYKTISTGKYDWQKYIFYIAILFMVFVFVIQPHKFIYMKHNENTKVARAADRPTLDQYFLDWLEANHNISDETNEEPINIILISGQGGGSTAGSWILANLLKVEATNPQFYKNIFSMSTVSGSSNGANFYLAIKSQHLLENDKPKDTANADFEKRRKQVVGDIYTKNYFSSNFLGLMFSDYFINPIISKIDNSNIDRNYILQQEEKNALLSAIQTNDPKKNELIKNYFDQNYLDIWRKKANKKVDQMNPLLFLNTTYVEEGRKAIFSPVKTGGMNFRAIDILENFGKTGESNRNFYIPISAAVAQSQAFPLLSTYNNVPGVGYLGDGGMYENTGTSTTLAIYKRLKSTSKSISEKYPKRKIRFILINFIAEKSKTPPHPSDLARKSMLMYTIGQAYKTPFNGHANDAWEELRTEVNNENANKNNQYDKDIFLDIENSNEFATTRLISRKTINRMFNNQEIKQKGADAINNIFKKYTEVRKQQLLKNSTLTKAEKVTAKASIVYIHYSGRVNKSLMNDLMFEINNDINSQINENIYRGTNDINNYVLNVPGVEKVPSFDIDQIRYFHEEDRLLAERLQRILKEKGLDLQPQFFNYKNFSSDVPKGQLELWINNIGNYGKKSEQPSAKR
jgi:hypothetical protein